jgi:molybdenum cofactor biosynthesis protein B
MSSSTSAHRRAAPNQLTFSVLTISDTRTLATDQSGRLAVQALTQAGHQLREHCVVADDAPQISQQVIHMCQAPSLDVLFMTGGTGITARDQTPEAVRPLLDVEIPGFGELFRWLSYQEIGAATLLSRAFAGRRGETLLFCLPGSTAAVRLAMDKILVPELPHLVLHARS